MIYPMICRIFIMIRMARRGRVYETYDDLTAGIKLIKERDDCKLCKRCHLLWYLASALSMKDPYKILEVYNLFTDGISDSSLSSDAIDGVLEAREWTNRTKNATDMKDYFPDTAVNVIRLWRSQSLDYSDYDRIKNFSSKLIWPLEIIKGSLCERAGNTEAALQNYRHALATMPNWIPEAKTTFEKLSELR